MKTEKEIKGRKEVIEMILKEDSEDVLLSIPKRTRLNWKLWAIKWILEEEDEEV